MQTKKIRVTVDGKPFDVVVELPETTVVSSGTPVPASNASQTTSVESSAATSASSPSSGTKEGAIVSPLSGLVAAIPVKVGQEVKEGEHVLTLEAMKMNTFVFAPKNGKVKQIAVETGAAVQENQVLIVLE